MWKVIQDDFFYLIIFTFVLNMKLQFILTSERIIFMVSRTVYLCFYKVYACERTKRNEEFGQSPNFFAFGRCFFHSVVY